MVQFQEERLWGAAACLKAHETIIAETIEYTRNRKAFGKTILDNQIVHFKLAEMQTEVELLRALIYRAAEALVAGEDVTRLATMAKLKAGRLGRELTDACLQFWGGMGFMNETHVSRAYRDSRLTSIGGGADEVMLTVLCKMMGTLPGAQRERLMITLYHCDGARSFRPLWMLEELGLPYELKMLPFPPRVFAKEYLALNPLGTIPFMVDGETKMTESSGICHYIGTRYGPTPLIVGPDEPAYGAFLNWMYFSDATLTFPQTLVLQIQPARAGGAPQSAGRRRLRQMVPRPAAGGRGRDRQGRDAVRGPLYRGRYRQRLCAAAGRQYRARQGFRAQCRGLLGAVAGARRLSAGGGGGTEGRRRTECGAAGEGLIFELRRHCERSEAIHTFFAA